ncbi:DUF4244 domain-containing protein [Microbacterium sp. cx-55]|nr:DUF4244 domain-containing protein [Microbacterium sp. cx-55]UGB34564.1 DUF4244 domain-containing protein [Microbacterium sp. cx-55]
MKLDPIGMHAPQNALRRNRAILAAVAFAGLLVVIMRSDEVRGILEDLIRRALTVE